MKVGMAQPAPRRQALDQGENASGGVLRNAVGDPRHGGKPVAQGGCVRRRGRLMNRYVERREDRPRLVGRHDTSPQELPQGQSVKARQHDAEAPLQSHLVKHLRRWNAGGESCAGHSRLVLAQPPRDAGLEQLHNLTGRPGVNVRRGAFADLLPQGAPHARPPEPPRLLAYDLNKSSGNP